ncbi:hypothetical protein SAV14893_084540 [Streptomyces avermitilis]|uniref:Uncharacterized protein n=1 Tax=Streptomyces avermitilis TaxID=33903 RepID=A0A4D4MAQ8_STRAX|nr:hypothetical protein SAV14893_084540 [Streptomyces avermitilis]GDY70557.1 hypothetical protein SAV31267_000420 [Streptomyces avermitilis]
MVFPASSLPCTNTAWSAFDAVRGVGETWSAEAMLTVATTAATATVPPPKTVALLCSVDLRLLCLLTCGSCDPGA